MIDGKVKTISNTLSEIMDTLGLKTANLVGLGSDGAAVMIGKQKESVKLRFAKGDAWTCAGRIEVSVKGNWESVCSDKLNHNELCKKLECGNKIKKKDVFGKGARTNQDICTFMSELCEENKKMTCNSNEDIGIICEKNMDIILQDSSGKNPCSGRVMIRYQKRLKPVVSMGWNISEATVLCRQLHCGKLLDVKEETGNFHNYKNWMEFQFKCNGNESSIWDCQTYTQNLIINTPVHVTCTDEVNISLKDEYNEDSCSGFLHITKNGTQVRLRGEGLQEQEANVLCKEMNCGSVLTLKTSNLPMPVHSDQEEMVMDHIKCLNNEYKLWQCGKILSGNVSRNMPTMETMVVCEEGFDVDLSYCGGKLIIHGHPNGVCPEGFTKNEGDKVCQKLHCGNMKSFSTEDASPQEKPQVLLNCNHEKELPKCLKRKECPKNKYITLFCTVFDTDGEMEKRVEQKDTAKGSQDDIAMKETAFDQETQLDEDGDNQMSLELQLQDDYDDVDCINISEQNRSSPQLIEGNEEGEQ
ncbi:C163B protein, partial [Polypterus senegalus]